MGPKPNFFYFISNIYQQGLLWLYWPVPFPFLNTYCLITYQLIQSYNFKILWGLQNNVYCFLKTVKNEGILTSAIFFSLAADWVAETVGIQNNILTVLESNFIFDYLQMFQIDLISFIVLNATFSNISTISWWPVLVVEETGVPRDNQKKPWAINW